MILKIKKTYMGWHAYVSGLDGLFRMADTHPMGYWVWEYVQNANITDVVLL